MDLAKIQILNRRHTCRLDTRTSDQINILGIQDVSMNTTKPITQVNRKQPRWQPIINGDYVERLPFAKSNSPTDSNETK